MARRNLYQRSIRLTRLVTRVLHRPLIAARPHGATRLVRAVGVPLRGDTPADPDSSPLWAAGGTAARSRRAVRFVPAVTRPADADAAWLDADDRAEAAWPVAGDPAEADAGDLTPSDTALTSGAAAIGSAADDDVGAVPDAELPDGPDWPPTSVAPAATGDGLLPATRIPETTSNAPRASASALPDARPVSPPDGRAAAAPPAAEARRSYEPSALPSSTAAPGPGGEDGGRGGPTAPRTALSPVPRADLATPTRRLDGGEAGYAAPADALFPQSAPVAPAGSDTEVHVADLTPGDGQTVAAGTIEPLPAPAASTPPSAASPPGDAPDAAGHAADEQGGAKPAAPPYSGELTAVSSTRIIHELTQPRRPRPAARAGRDRRDAAEAQQEGSALFSTSDVDRSPAAWAARIRAAAGQAEPGAPPVRGKNRPAQTPSVTSVAATGRHTVMPSVAGEGTARPPVTGAGAQDDGAALRGNGPAEGEAIVPVSSRGAYAPAPPTGADTAHAAPLARDETTDAHAIPVRTDPPTEDDDTRAPMPDYESDVDLAVRLTPPHTASVAADRPPSSAAHTTNQPDVAMLPSNGALGVPRRLDDGPTAPNRVDERVGADRTLAPASAPSSAEPRGAGDARPMPHPVADSTPPVTAGDTVIATDAGVAPIPVKDTTTIDTGMSPALREDVGLMDDALPAPSQGGTPGAALAPSGQASAPSGPGLLAPGPHDAVTVAGGGQGPVVHEVTGPRRPRPVSRRQSTSQAAEADNSAEAQALFAAATGDRSPQSWTERIRIWVADQQAAAAGEVRRPAEGQPATLAPSGGTEPQGPTPLAPEGAGQGSVQPPQRRHESAAAAPASTTVGAGLMGPTGARGPAVPHAFSVPWLAPAVRPRFVAPIRSVGAPTPRPAASIMATPSLPGADARGPVLPYSIDTPSRPPAMTHGAAEPEATVHAALSDGAMTEAHGPTAPMLAAAPGDTAAAASVQRATEPRPGSLSDAAVERGAAAPPSIPSTPHAPGSDVIAPETAIDAVTHGYHSGDQGDSQPMPPQGAAALPAPPRPSAAPQHSLSEPASEAVPAAEPAVVAVSAGARRFLTPLTGVDPESVALYRESPSAPVLGAHGAAALTTGDTVVLGATGAEETPQMLGLLAHELTHVARQRQPRFIPPVARDGEASAGGTPLTPSLSTQAHADEERMARQVEARVVAAARRRGSAAPAPLAPAHSAATIAEDVTVVAPGQATIKAQESPHTAAPSWSYSRLPAPWEPLPAWIDTATTPNGQATDEHGAAPFTGSEGSPGVAAAVAPVTAGDSAVHLAPAGRPLPADERERGAGAPRPSEPTPPPGPDIDTLARQVYAALRRRLAVEYRQSR